MDRCLDGIDCRLCRGWTEPSRSWPAPSQQVLQDSQKVSHTASLAQKVLQGFLLPACASLLCVCRPGL